MCMGTAAELPSSSVAINPANYEIHYARTIPLEQGHAYAFRIPERSKRAGLIVGDYSKYPLDSWSTAVKALPFDLRA